MFIAYKQNLELKQTRFYAGNRRNNPGKSQNPSSLTEKKQLMHHPPVNKGSASTTTDLKIKDDAKLSSDTVCNQTPIGNVCHRLL